jgi:fructose-1-phosphate kinase PfkB-like protein
VTPNRHELAVTLGRDLSADAALFAAMGELNQRGAAWAVITDGKNPAYASSAGGLFRLDPLEREVVNPIGCGDCMAAGIAWATGNGRDPLHAIRYGMAASADKIGRLLPGEVDVRQVEAIAESIAATRL